MWTAYDFKCYEEAKVFCERNAWDKARHWYWGFIENYCGVNYTLKEFAEDVCPEWFDEQECIPCVILYDTYGYEVDEYLCR